MGRLGKHHLFFIETPLMPGDLDGCAKLAQATAIPIAAGELLQTRFEFCRPHGPGKPGGLFFSPNSRRSTVVG